jgi:hypothetical protein
VLDAVARALQLDEAESAHLFDLARAAAVRPGAARGPRRPAGSKIRPGVQRVLDAITDAPAWVRNGRMDFMAANQLGAALYAPLLDSPARPTNNARFMFLDPAAKDFYLDWDRSAGDTVAILRQEAGRDPYDKALTDLVGGLSTRSEEFRVRWAAHNVRFHRTGVKQVRHPVVGELDLRYEAMELSADNGLVLFVYTRRARHGHRAGPELPRQLGRHPRQRRRRRHGAPPSRCHDRRVALLAHPGTERGGGQARGGFRQYLSQQALPQPRSARLAGCGQAMEQIISRDR